MLVLMSNLDDQKMIYFFQFKPAIPTKIVALFQRSYGATSMVL